jgi:urea transport system ATP-binding protein
MFKVEQLNQYYGGSHILRDVGFTLEAGRVTCLLGRNGVGKTTLLKCLMGLLPARSGYVPQGREIFPRLTVAENLQMGLAGLPAREKLPPLIFELFPVLKDMLHRRGGDLSGGQQQQLSIGRALAMRPKLLILDEPTEGIQPSIIKDIERAIRRLSGEGEMAILLVEQYYDFARDLADQYLVMVRGEIIKRGAGDSMDTDNVRSYLSI